MNDADLARVLARIEERLNRLEHEPQPDNETAATTERGHYQQHADPTEVSRKRSEAGRHGAAKTNAKRWGSRQTSANGSAIRSANVGKRVGNSVGNFADFADTSDTHTPHPSPPEGGEGGCVAKASRQSQQFTESANRRQTGRQSESRQSQQSEEPEHHRGQPEQLGWDGLAGGRWRRQYADPLRRSAQPHIALSDEAVLAVISERGVEHAEALLGSLVADYIDQYPDWSIEGIADAVMAHAKNAGVLPRDRNTMTPPELGDAPRRHPSAALRHRNDDF